ncbi:MAG: YggS family pyridoxal phosphate-dependent enzyme [Anaerolineae bacterium]
MTLVDHLHQVQERIAAACARAGRDPSQVTLVAVSKTHPFELILEAVAAGLQHFGENRVEEAAVKIPQVLSQTDKALRWHMIGHIQSRKARLIPPLFDVVHSVDDYKLAGKLSATAVEENKVLDVLLQVNVSGEESKSGFNAVNWQGSTEVREQLWREVQQVLTLPNLKVRGLMTMAPIVEDMEQTRPVFASLAALRAELSTSLKIVLPDLSMGMTDDFPVAIEEGATLIRVGRAIFGERL